VAGRRARAAAGEAADYRVACPWHACVPRPVVRRISAEFLRELVPDLRRLAFLGNASNSIVVQEMGEVKEAAHTLGLDVVALEIRRPEDIMPAFETLRSRAQALYVAGDPLLLTNRARINTLALVARLPAIYGQREYVEPGGLILWTKLPGAFSARRRLC
jgi:ABC-type uncharacterized transport system substrate-binding protein